MSKPTYEQLQERSNEFALQIQELKQERDELVAQVERERDDLADQVQSLVDAVMFGNDDDVLHAAERFVDAARAKTKGAEK